MLRNHLLSTLVVGPFALILACSTTPNPTPRQTSSSSSSSTGEAGAGGVAGMGGAGGTGGMVGGAGGMAGSGGSMMASVPKSDFGLMDVNPNSATSGQTISPRDYVGQVSAWYFGHST